MPTSNNNAPTVDQQISSFKGVTTNNGEVTAVQESRPLGGSVNNDEDTGVSDNDGDQGAQDQHPSQQQPNQPRPRQKSAQERIDLAVKRQREAERRADVAEGRYQSLEQRFAQLEHRIVNGPLTNGQAQNNAHDPSAPDPVKYQYGELDSRYIADLARHETQKTIEANNERQAQATREQQIAAHKVKVDELGQKGAQKYEDFVETVIETAKRNEWPLPRVVGELAMESDHGPDILYHLATNHAEAEKLKGMSPAQQARWFGLQEAKWSAGSSAANRGQSQQRQTQQRGQEDQGQTVRTTQAPQPLTRVRGSGNVQSVSADTTDFAAFEAMANEVARRRH